MKYAIEFSSNAQKIIKKWKKSNPNAFKKLYKILPELESHPYSGTGRSQSYSSWSCSPAELHYASDCGAKVLRIIQTAKNKTTKFILQFELLSTNYSKISCKMSYTPNTHPR